MGKLDRNMKNTDEASSLRKYAMRHKDFIKRDLTSKIGTCVKCIIITAINTF